MYASFEMLIIISNFVFYAWHVEGFVRHWHEQLSRMGELSANALLSMRVLFPDFYNSAEVWNMLQWGGLQGRVFFIDKMKVVSDARV